MRLSDSNRGRDQVYIWLEPAPAEKGVLESYGDAHADALCRTNMHYFSVVGDSDKLVKVIESFSQNTTNLSSFIAVVFDWKNEPKREPAAYCGDRYEPDLFTRMKELYLHIPGKPVHKIKIS